MWLRVGRLNSNQGKHPEQNIGSISDAIAQLAQLLTQLNSQRAVLDDPKKAAIRAVWRALDQTRMHLGAIRQHHADPNAPKQELAELWSDAALAISDVDSEFAGRLRMKAQYWSDPNDWKDIPGLDISIDAVEATARDLLPDATRSKPAAPPKQSPNPDIFISHASEDTNLIAKPLADALSEHGYLVWLDKYVLRLGDSLTDSIDEGLRTCRYGAVVLSPNFFRKEWPQRELDGLVALEKQDQRKRILPIWHGVNADEIAQHSPILADRLGVSTDLGMDVVVSQIVDVLEADVDKRSLSQ